MTVLGDLEKALAMVEASKGNYLLFATDSEDEKAKQVFKDMAADMERHAKILQSRMDYLDQNNQLNAGGSDDEDSDNGGGSSKKKKNKSN